MPCETGCTHSCCTSAARQQRRLRARLSAAALEAPASYTEASVDVRIAQLRQGDVPVEAGLHDSSPRVREVAALLQRHGPALHDWPAERLHAMARRTIDPDMLDDLLDVAERRGDEWLRLRVACNPHVSITALQRCSASALPGCRAQALLRLHELHAVTAEQLATEGRVPERMAVARIAPPEVLGLMVDDPSPRVRRACASRVTRRAHIERLARDPDVGVRRALLHANRTERMAVALFAGDEELHSEAAGTVAESGWDDLFDLFGLL